LVATKVRAALEFEGMCLQTSSRIVCIAFMVSILNSCMVILKWPSQGVGESSLAAICPASGSALAKVRLSSGLQSLLTLRLRSPLSGHGFEPARGKETAPEWAEAICGGVVPVARDYKHNAATGTTTHVHPSGLPRSD
jgi:hypothetical protein